MRVGRSVAPRAHAVFAPLFNQTFLPACSAPCGLAENGLPVGAQLVGHRFEDAAAARIETAAGAAFRRPRRIAPAPAGTQAGAR